MTHRIYIKEIPPGWEFRFRIVNSRTGLELKSYCRQTAERTAREMQAADPSCIINPNYQ